MLVKPSIWQQFGILSAGLKLLFCATNLGTTKFPFLYLTQVTLLTPAQD